MESSGKWGALLLLAAVGLGGCMTPPTAGMQPAQAGRFGILAGPLKACPTEMIGNVPICQVEITVSVSGGVCAASLTGEIQFAGPQGNGNIKPRIIWTLKPTGPIPSTVTFAFQPKSGFLSLADDDLQIDGGGRGDGAGGPPNPMKYFVRNLRTKLPSSVTYLPIIMQTDSSTSPATVSLCAVNDPKIVNME